MGENSKIQWCPGTGTAFFFKQFGGIRKQDTGRLLDGRTYDKFPTPTEDFDPTVYFEPEEVR
jgi:protein gp37